MLETIQSRLERITEEMEEALNNKDDHTYFMLEATKKELEKTLKEWIHDDENE